MKQENMIVGVTEAAKYVGKTTSWIYKLIELGVLNPITPYRGRPVFDKTDLDLYKKR